MVPPGFEARQKDAPSLHLNANTRRSLMSRGAQGLEPTTVLSELQAVTLHEAK